MTQREKFAAYLDHVGAVLITKGARYWTYSRPAGGYYYLGTSGSFRFGRNRTTCAVVSDQFKARALAWAEGSTAPVSLDALHVTTDGGHTWRYPS